MLFPLEKTFEPKKYLALSVEKPAIPDFIQKAAKENKLIEKSPVHVSVLVTKNAQTVWQEIAKKNDPETILRSVELLFKRYAWEYSLTPEYFLHERAYSKRDLIENGDIDVPEHTRRTIVQKVNLPDLPIFYKELNQILKTSIPLPVPHVALFAWSDYAPLMTRGIGINSTEEFEKFTKQRFSSENSEVIE